MPHVIFVGFVTSAMFFPSSRIFDHAGDGSKGLTQPPCLHSWSTSWAGSSIKFRRIAKGTSRKCMGHLPTPIFWCEQSIIHPFGWAMRRAVESSVSAGNVWIISQPVLRWLTIWIWRGLSCNRNFIHWVKSFLKLKTGRNGGFQMSARWFTATSKTKISSDELLPSADRLRVEQSTKELLQNIRFLLPASGDTKENEPGCPKNSIICLQRSTFDVIFSKTWITTLPGSPIVLALPSVAPLATWRTWHKPS